ncbi:hypothetical protein Glove_546g5 [Diversispora epigaea]|uniref:Uncharacterized protein n=1 Tax=Diversispora epigaea TaxID=1348612 RepID=A0A397GDP4_9GLOM|nr:hypothetical protein Glove_546g5 [Diversispora epigaea]
MSAITTKFVKQYNLNSQMSNSELSQYASKLLDAFLNNKKRDHTWRRFRDGYKFSGMIDKNIREKSIEILRNKYKFSEEQVNNLLQGYNKRKNKVINITRGSYIKAVTTYNGTSQSLEEETIKDMAQRILRDKLNTRDVKAEAFVIALSALNANTDFSRLSRLQKEL